jgi:protein-tyrosine phosphatase
MDHIHRFRRSKHQAGATPVHNPRPAPPPPILTPPTDSSPSKPSPPGTPPSTTLNLPVPLHSTKPRKLSPFRNFHLRPSSHKRARDSPPASLPHSPATAEQRPRTAHAASSDGLAGAGAGALAGGQGETTGVDGAGDTVRMPGFLELGEKGNVFLFPLPPLTT